MSGQMNQGLGMNVAPMAPPTRPDMMMMMRPSVPQSQYIKKILLLV